MVFLIHWHRWTTSQVIALIWYLMFSDLLVAFGYVPPDGFLFLVCLSVVFLSALSHLCLSFFSLSHLLSSSIFVSLYTLTSFYLSASVLLSQSEFHSVVCSMGVCQWCHWRIGSMGSSSRLRTTETFYLASCTKTYTNCFDRLVAMFSPYILRQCNRFTCNIYVITVVFCQLWISSLNDYWLLFIDYTRICFMCVISPFFGHCICCNSEEELYKWLSALLRAQVTVPNITLCWSMFAVILTYLKASP